MITTFSWQQKLFQFPGDPVVGTMFCTLCMGKNQILPSVGVSTKQLQCLKRVSFAVHCLLPLAFANDVLPVTVPCFLFKFSLNNQTYCLSNKMRMSETADLRVNQPGKWTYCSVISHSERFMGEFGPIKSLRHYFHQGA